MPLTALRGGAIVMHVTTQGIVLLERCSIKNPDRILTVLTQDLGEITVSARPRKRAGESAASQMLVWSEMTLYEYRQRWGLKEAVTNREFRGVREIWTNSALASYFAEVTEQLTLEQLLTPELLALLLNALYALEKLDRPLALVKAAFEMRAMCLSGYEPLIGGCAVCGETPVQPQFHLREGVLHCKRVRQRAGGGNFDAAVSGHSLAALRHIVCGPAKRLYSFRLDSAAQKAALRCVEAFLLTQLERGFHTLDFYKQITLNHSLP